jgi:hypothetical protein
MGRIVQERERERESARGGKREREKERARGGDLIKATAIKPNAAATRSCTTHLFFGGGGGVGEYVCAGGR